MDIINKNKINNTFFISILLITIFTLPNAIAGLDPFEAKKLFNENPIDFLSKYPVNTSEIFQDKNISHQHNLNNFGYIKLVEKDTGFKIEFATKKDKASIPAYFLYSRYKNNTAPSFIDIPKKALNGTLVITPPLSFSTIAVTKDKSQKYRVYRDSRPNSAVLYNNIVLGINQSNYHDEIDDVAGVYLMYNQDQWQIFAQPLKVKENPSKPLENQYILREPKQLVKTQRIGEISDKIVLDNFNQARHQAQQDIVNAAKNLGIKIHNIPQDIDLPIDLSPRVDENFNTVEWHELRELIRRALSQTLAPLIREINNLNQSMEKTKNEKVKSELEIKIKNLKLTLKKYDKTYYKPLKTSTTSDWLWLWLQKKNNEGDKVVFEPHGGPFTDIKKRLIDKFHSESELLENLNGAEANAFGYGKKHYQEIVSKFISPNTEFTDLINTLFDDTLTLSYRQKGALVQKIKLDYRQHILQRKSKNREQIIQTLQKNGAMTIKLVNQKTLLLERMGRCLPLSRIMASAIAQYGDNGVHSFINTVNTATNSPESMESINILNSIKFLHTSFPALKLEHNMGNKNIKDISSMLNQMKLKKGDSSMILLNTQTHSMLVGKANQSDQIYYYFYDPNYGVFKFHTTVELKTALNEFFVTLKLAKTYDSFRSNNKPEFNLSLIDTDLLSKLRLSTSLTITDLIKPKLREPNRLLNRLQLAMTRSTSKLTTDMKLQSNLQALESINLATEFTDSLTEIYKANKLDASWLPVFDSIQQRSAGDYSLTFIRKRDNKITKIISNDDKLWEFKQYYSKQLDQLKKTHDFSSTPAELDSKVTQAEHLSSLNAAFSIKAIINTFKQRINQHSQTKSLNNSLNKALAIHTDINLTQMIDGTVVDILKITNLYRIALKNGVLHTSSTLSKVGHIAHQGFAMGLVAASVILDGYEYANAQNAQEKAIFGSQLAFDSSYLAINIASVGTGLIGATTASAVLGVAGDIFAGLTVGFIGLAQALGEIADNAKAVGQYFYAVDNAYKLGGYHTVNKKMKDGSSFTLYSPLDGAVISHLDLANSQVTFDSQYLYPSRHGSTGSGASNYFFWAGDFPQMKHNQSNMINVRATLDHPKKAKIMPNKQLIVLPATPKSYISYDYQILPGATTRHDKGFDILRKIESKKAFDYDFYIFPSEYIAYKITQEYQPTNITINFGKHDQSVLMRKLNKTLQHKINYKFIGNGARYRIGLQTGANIQLDENNSGQTTWWIFDARYLKSNQTNITSNTLMVGGINIDLTQVTTPKILIIKKQNEMVLVDIHRRQFIPINEDLSKWPSLVKLNQHLEAELQQLHLDNQLIKIKNFIPQGKTQPVGSAYYQPNKKRYIYTPAPTKSTFLDDAKLITINGDLAYFAKKHQLWLVDVKQTKVLTQYHLFIPDDTVSSPIYSQGWIEGNSVYFSVKHTLENGDTGKFTYSVTPNKLTLIDINGDTQLMAELIDNVSKSSTMTNQFLHMQHDKTNTIDLTPEKWVFAARANLISTSANIKGQNYRYWILKKSTTLSTIITANINTNLPRDLLMVNYNLQTSRYYFYSHSQKRLYLQEGYHKPAKQVRFEKGSGALIKVFNQQGQLFALTSDNSIWLIDKYPWLAGVSHDWLKVNYAQVINKITTHSNQFQRKLAQLKVIGIKNSKDKLVSLWFDQASAQLIATIQTKSRKSMQYVGLSEDLKWAWLLNRTDNTLYKQAVVSNDITLNDKLILSSNIPEPISSSLLAGNIEQAKIIGHQLQLNSPDGMIFEVNKINYNKQQPKLVALTSEWQRSHSDTKLALQKLRKQYQLAEKIRLSNTSWYLTKQQRTFRANIQSSKPLVYIGESVAGGDYFYNSKNKTLYWQKNKNKFIKMGLFSYINIETDHSIILKIDNSTSVYKLPRVKNINTLLVNGTNTNNKLIINKSTLKHYRNILILSTGHKNKIRIKFDTPQKTLINRDNNNLSIYDPISNTSILILETNKISKNKSMIYTFNEWYYLYSLLLLLDQKSLIKDQVFTLQQVLNKSSK